MSGPAHNDPPESWMEELFGKDERVIVSNPDPSLWPDKDTDRIPQEGDVTHTQGEIESAVDAATKAAKDAAKKLEDGLTYALIGLFLVAVIVVAK